MKNKFKKFGGSEIPDVGEHIRQYLKLYPQTSVYVGTDSKVKGGKISYATIIAMYDEVRKDGVHYIFKRDSEPGKLDLFSRMWREVEKSVEVADYLEVELEGHLKRYSIEDLMVLKNPAGGYYKMNQTKLVMIDVDINAEPGPDKENRSNIAYSAAKGFLVGLGYRTRFKNERVGCVPWAANCAADTICNGGKKRSKPDWAKRRKAA